MLEEIPLDRGLITRFRAFTLSPTKTVLHRHPLAANLNSSISDSTRGVIGIINDPLCSSSPPRNGGRGKMLPLSNADLVNAVASLPGNGGRHYPPQLRWPAFMAKQTGYDTQCDAAGRKEFFDCHPRVHLAKPANAGELHILSPGPRERHPSGCQ